MESLDSMDSFGHITRAPGFVTRASEGTGQTVLKASEQSEAFAFDGEPVPRFPTPPEGAELPSVAPSISRPTRARVRVAGGSLDTTGASAQSRAEEAVFTGRGTQRQFVFVREVQRDCIVSKLEQAGLTADAVKLRDCGTRWSVLRCKGCAKERRIWNHCDRLYCPQCQPKLARRRAEELEGWARMVRQPKHVVLTVRNFSRLTKNRVRAFKTCIKRLRRSAFARAWRGGCWSIELTREGRGWHLHAHLLVDAPWIGKDELQRVWARIVGQEIAICHVKSCKSEQYLAEVSKYAVKGNQLAAWTAQQVHDFVQSFRKEHTHGKFGSLYKVGEQWRKLLRILREQAKQCECGCREVFIISAEDWQMEGATTIPPPFDEPKREIPAGHLEFQFN